MAFLGPPAFPPGGTFGTAPTPQPPSNNFSAVVPKKRRANAAFTLPNPFKRERTFLFQTYSVKDRNKLPLKVVDQYLAPLKGRPLQEQDIRSALDSLDAWYQQHYYVCARVLIVKMPTKSKPHLQLASVEPNLTVLTTVAVGEDNKPDKSIRLITRHKVISNALGVEEGDPFLWSPTGFARLIALGVFEHLNAEVKLHTPQDAELILYLRERKPGRIEPGAGISSDGRVYGDISVVDSNFMGRAQRLRVEWQKRLDIPRASGGIAFEDMRVGARIPLSFRVRAYRDANADRDLPEQSQASRPAVPVALQPDLPLRYEADRDGLLLDVGFRPGSSSYMFNLTPMLELVHRTGLNNGSGGSTQGVLQTSFTHATRPVVDLPREGHLIRVENSVGKILFTAPNTFRKTIVKFAKYLPFGERASIASGVTISIGSDNLPFHEHKSLGGHGSVRGYSFGELGRFKSYATGRVELRVPLAFIAKDETNSMDEEAGKGTDAKNGEAKMNAGSIAGKKEEKAKNDQNSSDATDSEGNEAGGSFFDKMPPLVGAFFGDVAVADHQHPYVIGASYGIGLRIGGIIAVDWTTAMDGRKSQVHFGLVDRSL